MQIRLFCTLFFLASFCILKGQSYVADTLYANFKSDTIIKPKKRVSFNDKRDVLPHFISAYEKKKWLFFPVDQIVLTKQPLAAEFENSFNTEEKNPYHIYIYEYNIDHNESMFKRTLNLSGAFELYNTINDTTLMGVFYYDFQKKFNKKKAINEAFNTTIHNFKSEFTWDINAVISDTNVQRPLGLNHFRPKQKVAPKNFYLTTDIFYGYSFWGFDAELYFSSPEPAQKFKRKSRMFRYINAGNRQSVAFSSGVKYFNYRLNTDYLFQNKSAFLLGFNKWNDVDEEKRTFEEIFLFQFSMMQRITFNKLDKSGFNIGIGLMEELSYVIYNKPMLNVGILFHCSYKF